MIEGVFVNSGTVQVSSGTLVFLNAVTGSGSDVISASSVLEFDANASSSQAVAFNGANSALELLNPANFHGTISGFDLAGASNDAFILGNPWTYKGFAENAGLTEGTMTLSNGVSRATLTLLGDYTAADFAHKTNSSGQTVVTYT